MNIFDKLTFTKGLKFSWGIVIALGVLLAYTYFAFMGFSLCVDGKVWIALLAAAGFMIVMVAVVGLMCLIKANKGKSIVRLTFFGLCCLIIIAILLLSGKYFTGYVKLIGEKSEVDKNVSAIVTDAQQLEWAYSEYVEERTANYLVFANGNPNSLILANSMKMHLEPESLVKIREKREQWLQEIEGMNIFNISFPANLDLLKDVIETWVHDYRELSDLGYGEDYELFEYTQADNSINKLWAKVKEPGMSWIAILAAVICAAVMIAMPWLVTETNRAQNLFKNDNNSNNKKGPISVN